ncbi:HpcH/HpaI aldolase/citrate lyase family protein [Dinoroseobacter sp. S375]|uniref:HpcH/HpaI aldolase/citrate lyase family protein n=1 Tax=Dinoroseobacter sp. S375 TaxID=3415136 RepID=UPI003C7B9F14
MSDPARPVRRALLFTPATRISAVPKGLASGVDCLCLDLEDAVPPDQKAAARPDAIGFLDGDPRKALRINGLRTRAGLEDLVALARAAPQGGMLLLPKVESAAEIAQADAVLGEAGARMALGALIESAAGLEEVFAIARATPRLEMLLFGAVDLAADLGLGSGEAPLAYARARVVHAGKGAGLQVLDVPELAFRDLDHVAARARTARDLGFTGKAAIHPSNVAPIQSAFTPSAAEIAEARAVMAAHAAAPSGLVVIDGRLIEAPVIRAMQARLEVAAAAGVL